MLLRHWNSTLTILTHNAPLPIRIMAAHMPIRFTSCMPTMY